ncbi:MAG TPA: sugar ABC transporter permease [Deinococcales bacterium]|nr:sugar ABC transporter permease [Deinococcales bacterium]
MQQATTVPKSWPRKSLWARFWGLWNEKIGYLFILPSFAHLTLFLLVPLAFSLYLSFHDWNGPSFQNAPYIGLDNYNFMLGDFRFWNALKNSAYYTVLAVPLGMIVSLGMAVVMNLKLRGSYFFRTLFFMPVISSWVAVSVVWITLLDPNAGVLNYILSLVGLPGVNWLGDPRWAMIAIVIVATWKGAGFSMVIWLAGLQGVPRELYEAASIDGAGAWAQFRFITVPMLAPTTFFLLITGIIGSFQVFSPVYVMTKGGPLGATDVVVFRIYQRAFTEFKMGYASAQAWVLFAIIFVLTLLQLWYMRRNVNQAYG